jgi:hypothetical protein
MKGCEKLKIVIKAHHLMHKPKYDYHGAELVLPASNGAILDALDRARVPYGSGEYQLVQHRDSPHFATKMLGSVSYNPSLAEMNHLAELVQTLSEDDMNKLEGILQLRNTYDVADAINATHNLHRFVQHPVFDDAELGEIAIDSDGMYEPLSTVSDELLECLDRAMVGALVRKQDNGVFTGAGYVFAEDDGWDEVFDGKSLAGREVTLEPSDPIISLYLRRCDMTQDDAPGAWLYCPATDAEIDAVLEKLEAKSLGECHSYRSSSPIPLLDVAFPFDCEIGKVNELARAISANCGTNLLKYKAAYELENLNDNGNIDAAIELASRLDEYDFLPSPSIAAFGRAEMERTGADVKTMEQYGFDFDAYGWNVMDEQKIKYLSYGFISHPRGPEQTPAMEQEQASAPEPTIGGM